MKRSPLQRRTPLARGDSELARTPLAQRSSSQSSHRIVDPSAGAAKVSREHRCRVCRREGIPLQRHHLVERSHGGDDVDDNLVPLCNRCHRAVHDRRGNARVELRSRLTSDELAYIIGKIGLGRLALRYPLPDPLE